MDVEKLDIYNKLNRIKPSNKMLKYPFNFWTPEKIKFTQKEIELKYKNMPMQNNNHNHHNHHNHHKKGGASSRVFVF